MNRSTAEIAAVPGEANGLGVVLAQLRAVLRHMRLFCQAFPNCDALRHELSWTHDRLLLPVEGPARDEIAVPGRLKPGHQPVGVHASACLALAPIGRCPGLVYDRAFSALDGGSCDTGHLLPGSPDSGRTVYRIATKYRLVLPSEEERRAELVREQRLLADELGAKHRRREGERG